jgi:hypothetical protein
LNVKQKKLKLYLRKNNATLLRRSPGVFGRKNENRTKLDNKAGKPTVMWTVEIKFLPSNTRLVLDNVNEFTSFSSFALNKDLLKQKFYTEEFSHFITSINSENLNQSLIFMHLIESDLPNKTETKPDIPVAIQSDDEEGEIIVPATAESKKESLTAVKKYIDKT